MINRDQKKARPVLIGSCMFAVASSLLSSCARHSDNINSSMSVVSVQQGDMSHHGGTPTIRVPFVRQPDDPATINDESNDQPLAHFGTATIYAHIADSGNTYTLDADIRDNEVQRIYFPKGGWVDFNASEIDSDGNGSGTDEQGREWEFEGYTKQDLTR